MSVTTTFDEWYEKLSSDEKRELMIHIVKNKYRPLNEGYYGGPSGILTKGLFAGPSGVGNSGRCPVCGK
jgi:hypothetical protein